MTTPTLRLLLSALVLLALAFTASAQLDERCTIAALNRTAQVDASGLWFLSNVPSNLGPVRIRATCVRDGVTVTGVSEPVAVPRNGIVFPGLIRFTAPVPVPASMTLSAPSTSLAAAGQSVQLSAVVTNPDSTTRDVTAAAQGTSYTTSNAGVVSVSAEGAVTATGNGVAIVSAVNEGALGLLRFSVGGPTDTDGDGIPDDFERAVGLNPNDPTDAAGDLDGDGLSNLREYQAGTDLRVADTDGDGVRDGLEVQLGTNPLDPRSFDLARALRRADVSPSSVVLRPNPLFPETRQQLTVTGLMLDGATIDLTPSTRGTTYTSSDLTVCNFGTQDGLLFAGAAGSCTVTVATNGFTVAVPVRVDPFTPGPLSILNIPGYANNVKVSDGFAYVAAGAAGLQIVDVRNPAAPAIIGSLPLPGVAIDVRIRGELAYIAAGTAGLQIVRIASPAAPLLVGAVDTPGTAQDVWVDGTHAYVADGESGLQVIDVSNPAAPAIVGSLATPYDAKGVSVSGSYAVVALDLGEVGSAKRALETAGNVIIVDVSVPAAPRLAGTTFVRGTPKDVVAAGTFAYVAASDQGLQIVDFSNPAAPRLAGGTGAVFQPRDIALRGSSVFSADQLFRNAIPFADVSNPAAPDFRAIIDVTALGLYVSTGIDADQQYVYVTGDVSFPFQDFYATGTTSLRIARYNTIVDAAGIAPTVRVTAPAPTATLIAGSLVNATLTATDDVAVDFVTFSVNGQAVATLRDSYTTSFRVPQGASSVTLDATATDFGGNVGRAPSITIAVVPDPLTTVRGTVRTGSGAAEAGATVAVAGRTGTTDAFGAYEIPGVPTLDATLVATASFAGAREPLTGQSAPVLPVRGGITTINVTVLPLPPGTLSSLVLDAGANGVDLRGTTAAAAVYTPPDPGVFLRAGTNDEVEMRSALDLFDVTNTVAPVLRGRVALPGVADEVRLTASRAYVAAEEAGVQVADISDAAHPLVLQPLANSSGARSLALSGSLLHVAAGAGGLSIYDVSDPALPRQLATLAFTRAAVKVAVRGSLVAVAEEATPDLYGSPADSNVDLVDVTSPQAPVVVGQLHVAGEVRSLALIAGQLYIAANEASVFDISTPAEPRPLQSPFVLFDTFGLAAAESRVIGVGAAQNADTLAVVVDPTGPTRLSTLFPGSGFRGVAAAADSTYAVVAGDSPGEKRLFVLKP